jgi:hypothetical protein
VKRRVPALEEESLSPTGAHMKPRIEVPAELAHLLEKREQEDRRKAAAAAKAKPPVERRKRNRRKPS